MVKQIKDRRIELSVDTKSADKLNQASVSGSMVPSIKDAPTISKEEVTSLQMSHPGIANGLLIVN